MTNIKGTRLKLLCAGVGQLNQRLAKLWAANGGDLLGYRRSAPDASLGFHQRSVDLTTETWPDPSADIIVIAVSAQQRTLEHYRQTYTGTVQQLSRSLSEWTRRPSRVLVVSSTRVYGEGNGSRIDDAATAQTEDPYGQCLLEMEKVVHDLPCESAVVRLSGIYGPGRDWLYRQALKPENDELHNDKWTNRIHIDDAAAAILHIAQLPKLASTYLVSDQKPMKQSEIFQYFRQRAGAKKLTVLSENAVGKRLIPSRLQDSGFKWQYPDAFSGGYDWLF